MTRNEAEKLAQEAAKANPPSYYREPFVPHSWVVDAILKAYEQGMEDQRDREHWSGWDS